MTSPLKIAVFASGNGSNFQALADAIASGAVSGAEIALVVCDKPSAYVLERAEALGVAAFVFRPKDYAAREDYERDIVARLQAEGIGLIVMAGYMRLVTQVLVEPFYGKMINIHPALLPAFPGINGARQALDYGVKITGATVHFVDGGMDTGPIIAQTAVEVLDEDTEASLAARIQLAEHRLLPQVVGLIAAGKVSLDGRKVTTTK